MIRVMPPDAAPLDPVRLEDVDLSDPDVFRESRHHAMFEVLRREDPVHWQAEAGGGGYWCITRHPDIVAVNRDAARFASGTGFTLEDIRDGDGQHDLLLGMDAPRHTRYRRIV